MFINRCLLFILYLVHLLPSKCINICSFNSSISLLLMYFYVCLIFLFICFLFFLKQFFILFGKFFPHLCFLYLKDKKKKSGTGFLICIYILEDNISLRLLYMRIYSGVLSSLKFESWKKKIICIGVWICCLKISSLFPPPLSPRLLPLKPIGNTATLQPYTF